MDVDVRPDDLHRAIQISSDLGRHTKWLQEYIAMGFDHIYVHNTNRDQQQFIEAFGEYNAVRTPMQWTDESHAGFSRAETTIRTAVSKGPYSYRRVNVEAQRRDPTSLLHWMASLIRLRHECPEIGWGNWKILSTGSPRTLAMCYEWQGTCVVVVHNFDEAAHEVRIRPEVDGGDHLFDLLEQHRSDADASGTHRIALDAYGYRWFRVGSQNYALRRTS